METKSKSEQARLDAMADAATLVLFFDGLDTWFHTGSEEWLAITQTQIKDGGLDISNARVAAHAAFKAVPELRG